VRPACLSQTRLLRPGHAFFRRAPPPLATTLPTITPSSQRSPAATPSPSSHLTHPAPASLPLPPCYPCRLQDHRGNPVGPQRVWLADSWVPGLAMSRAMGDAVAHSVGVTSGGWLSGWLGCVVGMRGSGAGLQRRQLWVGVLLPPGVSLHLPAPPVATWGQPAAHPRFPPCLLCWLCPFTLAGWLFLSPRTRITPTHSHQHPCCCTPCLPPTTEPETSTVELCPQDRWLLLATDGVWEFIDCQVGSERSVVKVQLPVLGSAFRSQHCCVWQCRLSVSSSPSPGASQLPGLVSPAQCMS
jgi:hypothetical protein